MSTELTARRILYEDADVLLVDKPPGLVSHATVDPRRDHLVAALRRLLRARDGEAGHLGLVHRLDRDTSGVVLLSRRAEHDATLGAAFAEHRIEKVYLAIVRAAGGASFPAGTIEQRAPLAPGRGPGGRTLVVRAGGKPSRTELRARLSEGELVLVEARPRTGRTHQIRVHLAELGFPILGDALYGGAEPDVKRLLLHAWCLGLPHPRTGEPLRVVAPPPRAFRSRLPGLDALEPG
ncbi:MAG: RluA family pseudouridine synthase [Myxococcales bacterium]|nr:RluA family pseudouridine synthase [Myxococcales bacterium]MCB9718942.1 RluA family pseudouridine synthase [Myxococcales bacterium]